MVVIRKNISVSKGEKCLFDEVRYFFYITNTTLLDREQVVWTANQRGNQENVLAQLHQRRGSFERAGEHLESNWAYMLGHDSTGWNLQSLAGIAASGIRGRWQQRHIE